MTVTADKEIKVDEKDSNFNNRWSAYLHEYQQIQDRKRDYLKILVEIVLVYLGLTGVAIGYGLRSSNFDLNFVLPGLFDILGHLDIYRRYGEEYYGPNIREIWKPYVKALVDTMKRHDVGFEVNTSSWRMGLSEPMPETLLAHELVKRGIRNVTVGSDSHSPATLGEGVQRAYGMIYGIGLSEVATFSHRKVTHRKIPL